MQKSLISKLNALVDRRDQLDDLLSRPEAAKDHNRFKELSKELSEIMPIVQCTVAFVVPRIKRGLDNKFMHDLVFQQDFRC